MTNPQKPSFWTGRYALAVLLVFVAIGNYVTLEKDNIPLTREASGWYQNSLFLYESVNSLFHIDGRPLQDKVEAVARDAMSSEKAKTLVLLTYPIYLMSGPGHDAAIMANLFFLVILGFSVYGIGKLIHDQATGFVAASVCILMPAVYASSRAFVPVFGLTAMISLNIYLLIRTNGFMNRKYAVLFALSSVLSFYTRPSFSIYLIGPFLVALLSGLRATKAARKCVLPNMAYMAAISFVLGLPQYLIHSSNTDYFAMRLWTLGASLKMLFAGDIYGGITFKAIWGSFQYLLGSFYLILFMLSLVWFLMQKTRHGSVLLAWIIVPVPILFVNYLADYGDWHWMIVRQLIICLPAFALIMALFLTKFCSSARGSLADSGPDPAPSRLSRTLDHRMIQAVLILAVILSGLFNFISCSFFFGMCPRPNVFPNDSETANFVGRFTPLEPEWDYGELLALVDQNRGAAVFFFSMDPVYEILQTHILRENILNPGDEPYKVRLCYQAWRNSSGKGALWTDPELCREWLRESSLVVFKKESDLTGEIVENPYGRHLTYSHWTNNLSGDYILVKTLNGSLGSGIEVFKKRQQER
ncbi:MAG: hypothetical protein ABH879_03910 [archaeon]